MKIKRFSSKHVIPYINTHNECFIVYFPILCHHKNQRRLTIYARKSVQR